MRSDFLSEDGDGKKVIPVRTIQFVYLLFINDAFCLSDYTASNDRVIIKWRTLKHV
jgi:hypothetical protein